MSNESFEILQKKIALINGRIKFLESEKDRLAARLQEICNHPADSKYRTSSSERCGRCDKVLQFWTEHYGNPI